MIVVLSGLLAGSLHVLTGPDHLAAIAPISIQGKSSSIFGNWQIGFRWGLGHTSGVILIGLLALLFRQIIPINLISSYSERLVGIVLIVIGIWGLKKFYSKTIHTHEHKHNGEMHIHIHAHSSKKNHKSPDAHIHTHAAFVVGIIHGLAGSSHLFGVLPALVLPTTNDVIIYLTAFGIGTISAMMIFSSIIGMIANKFATAGLKFYQAILFCFSIIAIGSGGIWLFI
jgi:sulfite exporter TauE/SafE